MYCVLLIFFICHNFLICNRYTDLIGLMCTIARAHGISYMHLIQPYVSINNSFLRAFKNKKGNTV